MNVCECVHVLRDKPKEETEKEETLVSWDKAGSHC